MNLPGRTIVGGLALGFAVLLVAADLFSATPIDPYQAPYPTALGSGQAPGVAHCSNVTALLD